jgi:hypothetical protein
MGRPRRVRRPRASWNEDSIQDVVTGLDRRASHFVVMNLTGTRPDLSEAQHVGTRVDERAPLASSWKMVVAAVILHARGSEFLNNPQNRREMARFLSRSTNEMGPRMAMRAFGSQQAFYEALQRFRTDLGLTSLLPIHANGIESSRGPDRRLSFFDATTGYNSDGVGPMASPRDMARVMQFLYQGNHGLPPERRGAFNVPEDQRGAFLRRYANPRGSGVGHTMAGYAFGNRHIEMIGCKSGSNPRAGTITASCLFRDRRTGDVFVGFMHTGSSGNRPGLVRGLQRVALAGFEAIEALGRPVVRGVRDLLSPEPPRPVIAGAPAPVTPPSRSAVVTPPPLPTPASRVVAAPAPAPVSGTVASASVTVPPRPTSHRYARGLTADQATDFTARLRRFLGLSSTHQGEWTDDVRREFLADLAVVTRRPVGSLNLDNYRTAGVAAALQVHRGQIPIRHAPSTTAGAPPTVVAPPPRAAATLSAN